MEEVQFYTVCLTNRPDRVEKVKLLQNVIPDLIVVDAVDGNFYTANDINKMTAEGFLIKDAAKGYVDQYIKGRPLTVGNVGSFVSHRKAIECVSKQEKKFGIVLEDDIRLYDDFLENIEGIIENVKDMDFDLIHMYIFENQRHMFPKVSSPQLITTPEGLWGLQCYLMTNTSAKKVWERLFPMKGATDEQITRIGLNGYTLLGLDLLEGEVIKSYTNTTKKLNDLI
jgi:GR25 family glycosyltransferase involved in LPS biosynthesis